MAEKVVECKIKKERGWLYFLDKKGNISRLKMESLIPSEYKSGYTEVVSETKVIRKKGYLYFIDKDGDISKTKIYRGRK